MPGYKLSKADLEKIRELFYSSKLTQADIGRMFGVEDSRISTLWSRWYTPTERRQRKALCYRRPKLGENNPMYRVDPENHPRFKGVVGDSRGYLMVLKPAWYTGRKTQKHVFQHHVVVCERMGLTQIPPNWHVHHCDLNKHNNEFDNLVLIKSGDHTRLHHWLRSEGVTTISKESTLKWVEANGTPFRGHDIVCSSQECEAAERRAGINDPS